MKTVGADLNTLDDDETWPVALTRAEADALLRAVAFGAYELAQSHAMTDAEWAALNRGRDKVSRVLKTNVSDTSGRSAHPPINCDAQTQAVSDE